MNIYYWKPHPLICGHLECHDSVNSYYHLMLSVLIFLFQVFCKLLNIYCPFSCTFYCFIYSGVYIHCYLGLVLVLIYVTFSISAWNMIFPKLPSFNGWENIIFVKISFWLFLNPGQNFFQNCSFLTGILNPHGV